MKRISLLAAGALILLPAIGAASQPAQAPPSQGTAQAQNPTDQPNPTCDDSAKPTAKSTKAKSADAGGASASESVTRVQRDTGDRPAPAKKPKSGDETACAAQPQ